MDRSINQELASTIISFYQKYDINALKQLEQELNSHNAKEEFSDLIQAINSKNLAAYFNKNTKNLAQLKVLVYEINVKIQKLASTNFLCNILTSLENILRINIKQQEYLKKQIFNAKVANTIILIKDIAHSIKNEGMIVFSQIQKKLKTITQSSAFNQIKITTLNLKNKTPLTEISTNINKLYNLTINTLKNITSKQL